MDKQERMDLYYSPKEFRRNSEDVAATPGRSYGRYEDPSIILMLLRSIFAVLIVLDLYLYFR